MTMCMKSVDGAARPAAPGNAVGNGWDAKWFDYERQGQMVVEETTPTARQVD